MLDNYWQKQGGEPLFPELDWNKPERKDQAGRLLIVGGNIHALNAPAKAFEIAKKTGIGSAKIVLPIKTKKLVELGGSSLDFAFLPSTSSGEFSKEGTTELLEYAQWADTLLLPGDIGRNSQTAILIEESLKSYSSHIVITKDAVDLLSNNPQVMLKRPKTTLVLSFSQLQKLIKNTGSSQAITFGMDLVSLVEFLSTFTKENQASIITLHQNQYIVAVDGRVSSTKQDSQTPEPPNWRLDSASIVACYVTWNPEKYFEALTHSVYKVIQSTGSNQGV